MRPQFSDFSEPLQGIGIKESVTIGRNIQNQVAVVLIERFEPLVDHLMRRTKFLMGKILFPEPYALQGIRRLRGYGASGQYSLPGMRLVLLYIRVIKNWRRESAFIVIRHEAISLE